MESTFKPSRRRQLLISVTVAAVALGAAVASLAGGWSQPHGPQQVAAATSSGAEPSLDEVRAATERFKDVNVALAEGYLRDPMDICETAEMMGRPADLGAMGIHFFRPDLLGLTEDSGDRVNGNGTHMDFLNPSILIYEPQADGTLVLVAVENLVFAKAWKEAGNTEPPSFQGVFFDSMMDDPNTAADEAHMFEPHFDRHVWIYRENPNGVFTPFNPAVSCQHHRAPGHQHSEVTLTSAGLRG